MRSGLGAFVLLVAVGGGLLVAVRPHLSHYQLTGRFFPVRIIETLQSPVPVVGWSEDGLNLADGRTVALPGVRKLPATSIALSELTNHGVELSTNGRIYGLIRVHNWCGNDPVEEHIARVDISHTVLMLQIAEPITPLPESIKDSFSKGGRFSEFGWNVSEFHMAKLSAVLLDPPVSTAPG